MPRPLPFAPEALVPFLSANGVNLHYQKYLNYFSELHSILQEYPELRLKTLPQLVAEYFNTVRQTSAQILNHEFFFALLTPGSNSKSPNERFMNLIQQQYGSYDQMVQEFNQKAKKFFGSGWIWLVFDPGNGLLLINTGSNEYNPLIDGQISLLCLDLWEHAYYPDYGNDKVRYIQNFWNYINWDFVNQQAQEHLFSQIP